MAVDFALRGAAGVAEQLERAGASLGELLA